MPYFEKRIYAGKILEVERYFCSEGGRRPRRGRLQSSTEAQQKLNYVNSRKKFVRTINANFARGDLYVTVTHGGAEPDEPAVAKLLAKFLRGLRGLCRRTTGKGLKYICVTEKKGKRIHHHLILSKLSIDAVAALWSHGRVTISPLDPDYEYEWLARYLAKEDKPGAKRWSQSNNLIKPREVMKEIKRIVLREEPSRPRATNCCDTNQCSAKSPASLNTASLSGWGRRMPDEIPHRGALHGGNRPGAGNRRPGGSQAPVLADR